MNYDSESTNNSNMGSIFWATALGIVQLSCFVFDRSHSRSRPANMTFEIDFQATEEAIVNAMVGAETMNGIHGHKVFAMPHERLREVLKKYNRLEVVK